MNIIIEMFPFFFWQILCYTEPSYIHSSPLKRNFLFRDEHTKKKSCLKKISFDMLLCDTEKSVLKKVLVKAIKRKRIFTFFLNVDLCVCVYVSHTRFFKKKQHIFRQIYSVNGPFYFSHSYH